MIKNNILAIIPAAGIGARFLSNMPKQYSSINETNIIQKTVSTFIHSYAISKIIIPVNKNDQYIKEQEFYKDPKIKIIQGGDTRAKSVLNALSCIDIKDYDHVLTHDVARPNIKGDDVNLIVETILSKKADCLYFYTPINESIKQISENKDITVDRDDFFIVQTPQICKIDKLYDALISAIDDSIDVPDESYAMERMGYKVLKILGNSSNIKVTFPEDLELVNKFNTRTGTGFDLHTYQTGTGFILGGHFIDCDYSINAHSDGDVLLHSIADAILGAAALGDIGLFFPDNDQKNKDLDSKQIIELCLNEISKLDLEIYNIDATVICEEPKIKPIREEILTSLASIFQIDQAKIGLKATTSEKIGIIGKNKAIAVQTAVNLKYKK